MVNNNGSADLHTPIHPPKDENTELDALEMLTTVNSQIVDVAFFFLEWCNVATLLFKMSIFVSWEEISWLTDALTVLVKP